MSKRVGSSALAAATAALAIATSAAAQSAQQIVERALEHHERRTAAIDNYTLVQEVMGVEVSNYFEKRMIDGRPIFVLVDTWGTDDSQDELGNLYNEFIKAADRFQLVGEETVDGRKVHVLSVEDFSGLDFGDEEEEDEDYTPKKGLFYLDTDDYVLRRMVMEGEMEVEGKFTPVTVEALFLDYRDVSGMLHPFRTEMKMSGFSGALSEEDLREAREALEEMKRQLAEMPESQRAMMESMLGEQMQNLEQMVNSGNLEVTIEVKELRVNQGPPK